MINNTMNAKNNILAILVAPLAIPPNPNNAAIKANTKNPKTHFSSIFSS